MELLSYIYTMLCDMLATWARMCTCSTADCSFDLLSFGIDSPRNISDDVVRAQNTKNILLSRLVRQALQNRIYYTILHYRIYYTWNSTVRTHWSAVWYWSYSDYLDRGFKEDTEVVTAWKCRVGRLTFLVSFIFLTMDMRIDVTQQYV